MTLTKSAFTAALMATVAMPALAEGQLNLYSSRHYDTDERLYSDFTEQTGITINRIEGNADERGTAEYNLALGARRAEAVRAYLVQQGVAASRIDTISFGKERPIAQGSNEESWARNRNAHTAIVSGAVR